MVDSTESVDTADADIRHTDVLVAVSDTGPGIPREELPKIFEAYRTIPAGSGRRDSGSTFFFTLPRT